MNVAGVEISAPLLSGLDADEVVQYLSLRRIYENAVKDKNVGVPASKRIIPVTLKATVPWSLLQFICEMELGIEVDALTDEMLRSFLETRSRSKIDNLDGVVTVFKEININTKISSASARIADLFAQWYLIKEKYKITNEFNTSEGKKVFRREMASKLWPTFVKNRVEKKLKDLDAMAEKIRSDDREFYKYVESVALENERSFAEIIKRPRDVPVAVRSERNVRSRVEEGRREDSRTGSNGNGSTNGGARSQNQRREAAQGSGNSGSRSESSQNASVSCLKCGGPHKVFRCEQASREEAKRLYSEWRLRKRARERGGVVLPSINGLPPLEVDEEKLVAVIDGKISCMAILDSAASHTFIPEILVQELLANDPTKILMSYGAKEVSWVASDRTIPILGKVSISLELGMVGASVKLRSVVALVLSDVGLLDNRLVFVGKKELIALGIHPLTQLKRHMGGIEGSGESDLEVENLEPLREAGDAMRRVSGELENETAGDAMRRVSSELENETAGDAMRRVSSELENKTAGDAMRRVSGELENETAGDATRRVSSESKKIERNLEKIALDELDHLNEDSEAVPHGLYSLKGLVSTPLAGEPLRNSLEMMVLRAEGVNEDERRKILELVLEYEMIWTLELKDTGPARVSELILQLKSDFVPKRCKSRRYSKEQVDFIHGFVDELVKAGCIYKNPNSRWSSPIYVVRKPKGGFRMTIDVRYPNSQLVPVAGVMPLFEVELAKLKGTGWFSNIDAFKGYWQFPLAKESQEIMSFQTDSGIYTPTRLIQGGSDSVFAFQGGMREVLGSLLDNCCSVWVDDILHYAESFDELLLNLRSIFERCFKFNVFLNPNKTQLCTQKVTWCGRVIDKEGVTYDEEMVTGLLELRAPGNGQELQQFICACNWMRSSMPEFAKIVGPLQSLLLDCTKRIQSSKSKMLKNCSFAWEQIHQDAFEEMRNALKNLVKLNHFDPQKEVCLFTDASDSFWGLVLTQIRKDEIELEVNEQEHKPLCFLSGQFSKSQKNWSTIEKEAYPIILALTRLKHFLLIPQGFRLFTDHRNLVFIFDPHSVRKPTSDRLARWADLLIGFRYTVEHINGISNVWADILSRWNEKEGDKPVFASITANVPNLDEEFNWPQITEIRQTQSTHEVVIPKGAVLDDGSKIYRISGKIWVPSRELQVRIMIVAHCASMGHRSIENTLEGIVEHFWWNNVKEDVRSFVKSCLHCLVNHHSVIPRPLSEQLHASERNEILHYDWLYINSKNKFYKYVLVKKEDYSNLVELDKSPTCDHFATVDGLIEWESRYGRPSIHISDNGSHFKNSVIKELHRLAGSKHHYVVAYSPWANGTVEVVNESILRLLRSLLSEFKMDSSRWPELLPLVQHILNHTPSRRLGGLAPITVFTGLQFLK
jgi:hypothetical protein